MSSDGEDGPVDRSMTDRWEPDCSRCVGLCCSVFAHRRGTGFPEDKPASVPCRHLARDFRCEVFETLEDSGYLVCRAYDCLGAGPVVTKRMIAAGGSLGPPVDQGMVPFMEDFRRLSRLHLLIRAVSEIDRKDARALRASLEAVSLDYEKGDVDDRDREVGAAVRPHRGLMEQVVGAMTSGGEEP
jgi:hypothetical protein